MELGNLIFGNSRGEYRMPRKCGYEEELERLFDAYAWKLGSTEIENDTFVVRLYYWGDCTCGYDDDENMEDHKPECPVVLPNFHYKPTDYRLSWYKYPLRDSYANQKLGLVEFRAMIDKCIESLS